MNRQEATERIKQNKAAAEYFAQTMGNYGLAENELKDIEAFNMAIKALESERPKGKWVLHPLMDEGRVELECSECGDTFVRSVGFRPHFCEHCGARMGK